MKKKVISVILAVLITMMMPTSALAARVSSENMGDLSIKFSDEKVMEQAEREVGYLCEIGLLGDGTGTLQKAEMVSEEAAYNGAAATIEYTIDYGNREEALVFNDLVENGVAFTAKDTRSGVENSLEMYDGTIILDGNEVECTTSNAEPMMSGTSGVVPMSSDRWYQVACPYGTAGSYTKYVRTTRNNNIDFSNSLQNVVYSVALTIILALAGAEMLTTVFTSALYGFLQSAAPTSRGLSYIDYQYWHNSCSSSSAGYISAYGAYVTKHIIDWYPFINQGGTPKASTEFEIHQIY